MSKRARRNHAPAFKARVVLAAVRNEGTLAEGAMPFLRAHSAPLLARQHSAHVDKAFAEWGEIFGDDVMAAALDRSPRPSLSHRQHPRQQLSDAPSPSPASRGGGSSPRPRSEPPAHCSINVHPRGSFRFLGSYPYIRVCNSRPPKV
jgi:hypothetical protein